ncbi:MAG: hypothetical protein J2P49_03435 [Methylocapsa sp.]|nr:hypothetical protein [Methylocapsa sp.]
MSDHEKAFGYIAFRQNEENELQEFVLAFDRAELANWKSEATGSSEASDADSLQSVSNSKEERSGDLPTRAAELLHRFTRAMSSVRSLVIYTSVIRPRLVRSFLERMLLDHARKHLTTVENADAIKVYSFTRDQFPEINKRLEKFRELVEGHATLPSATLLSLVATFDSYFAEIVKFVLSIHPERYTNSDRKIELKEIFAKKSLEEVIDHNR